MENAPALELDPYQTSVGNKDQLNKVMVSLLNKVTALLTCGKELKVVSSPTLRSDVTDQCGGRKEAISLTCPQLRVNGLIPPIEITAPDCTHQMLSCITLERQQLDVYPRPPLTPPSSPAFVSALLCIIPDENIICLLSVCLSHTNPNPQKWQLSYTGIMSPPPPPIQPRKINYKGLGLAFFCHCAPERWVDGKKQLRDDREEERERERARKKRRGDNIVNAR